jgi:threonine aldolase
MIIDLRSDTFTRPTPEMLKFMFEAAVGDDVFGEDPSINELEKRVASYFGKEASLFCPSGTMANQIAIKCHTQPGDEIICEENSHVYIYEGGGIAFNSGCQVKPIKGKNGLITAKQISTCINPDDIHKPRTALVSLENTSNRGGGTCYDHAEIDLISDLCKQSDIALHIDGARLWNAMIAKNESPIYYGEKFDSISVCFSKGLGAPVGSVLVGSASFIKKARRIRKVLGGGMRQAGYLASACLFALDHNIERLSIDHTHAKMLETALLELEYVESVVPVETNLIFVEIKKDISPKHIAQLLKNEGVLVMAISPTQIRMVTHLHIENADIYHVISVLNSIKP